MEVTGLGKGSIYHAYGNLGYLLLSVVRGIDSLAKGGVSSSVLQDVARSAIALLSPL